MYKYTAKNVEVLKDGHTMMQMDIISDLNRKSYLEKRVLELEKNMCIYAREELGDKDFDSDKEAIQYFADFAANNE